MTPSSDREREIARRIDERSSQSGLSISSIAELAASIPFPMSELETRFLVSYVVWRRDHPIGMEQST